MDKLAVHGGGYTPFEGLLKQRVLGEDKKGTSATIRQDVSNSKGSHQIFASHHVSLYNMIHTSQAAIVQHMMLGYLNVDRCFSTMTMISWS